MLDTSTHCDSKRSTAFCFNPAQRAAFIPNSDPATLNKSAQWQARWREGCGGELARGSAAERRFDLFVPRAA
jgi:hypothetical protein